MNTKLHFPVFVRIIFTIFIVSFTSIGAKAYDPPVDPFNDVYIIVTNTNTTIGEIFKLVEKQTSLSFVYDENDVNISKEIKISKGQHLLKNVLNVISEQANLHFTRKQNIILVNHETAKKTDAEYNKIATPVTGKVTDASGTPLQGVTVSLKGSRTAVETDADGIFSIEVPANGVLIFSNVNYQSQEVAVNGRSSLYIKMTVVNKQLNEVVVVGYQSQKRSNILGAVTTVNVNDISKIPIGFADQALQGQASGVRVTQSTGQPGDGVAVRIRGVGSINNNDPLYVIDGVPTQDGINFLAADDIASITILKDAASAAIYGARASNGVVVITTKNGKSGRTSIDYSVYGGVQTHGYLTPMANASEYKTIFNEMVANDNAGLAPNNPLLKKPIPDSIPMANTDWIRSIFRVAPEQDHELSVSGGNEKIQFSVSGNYFQQDGIILNSWYNRYTLRSKLTAELTKRLKIGTALTYSYYDKNSIGSSGDGLAGNGGSVVRYALFRDPAIPIYISPGVYSDLPQYPGFFGDGYNPVGLANNTNNIEKQYRGFGDVFVEYEITPDLFFKSDFGGDVFLTRGKTFFMNWGTGGRINNPNTLSEQQITSENMVWNNTFHYAKTFNTLHNFSFLAGTEAVSNTTFYNSGTQQNFPSQIPSLEYFGNGDPKTSILTESEQEWALMSFLANVNYNYNNEFFISGSGRRDGSSRFGPANRWGNFFSGAVGWNLMKEKWFTDLFPVFSRMKLRASYGQLGNQNIGDYPWASVVNSALNASNVRNYVFGAPQTAVQGMTVSKLGNTDVKWETSTQTDVGLDMAILAEQLSLSVDYFNKVNSDMLVAVPLPMIGGNASAPYVNDGSVQNKGFEFDLQY
ncbi:MAG: SusC/RagA family TonB-linked outer membrane protein, partial [Ginsengibacter sp.]